MVITETFTGSLLTALLLKVVLEVFAFLFGDSVSLGGYFSVTGLIIVLMLARAGVRRLLR